MSEENPLIGYYAEMDKLVVEQAKTVAEQQGTNVACLNCKSPACCKQHVMAFTPELDLIAETIKDRPETIERFQEWTRWFTELSPKEQLEVATPFRQNKWCPLLVDGKCSAYAVRPLACRGHWAIEDDETKCNSAEPVRMRTYNPQEFHRPFVEAGFETYTMALAVMALLEPDTELGKKSREVSIWLRREAGKIVEYRLMGTRR